MSAVDDLSNAVWWETVHDEKGSRVVRVLYPRRPVAPPQPLPEHRGFGCVIAPLREPDEPRGA
jgi:hypothetical protein